MPMLPASPSNTPGEGMPTPATEAAQRKARLEAVRIAGEKHLLEHYRNAKEQFHKELNAWQPEPMGKPLEEGKF